MKKSLFYSILVILVVFAFDVSITSAQLGRKLSISYEFIPSAVFKDAISDVPEDAEFGFNALDVGFSYPSILSKIDMGGHAIPTKILINDFSFSRRQVEQKNFSLNEELEKESYLSLGYMLLYVHNFSRKWGMIALVGTELSVDELDTAQGKDLSYQGGVLFDRRFDNGWTLGLGVVYAQFTGQGEFIPLPHIGWRNQKADFELGGPLGPGTAFWYHLNEMVSFGLLANLDGAEYMLTESKADLYEVQGDGVVVKEENVDVALSYSSFVVAPVMSAEITPGMKIQIEGGMTLERRYEYRAPEENETLRFESGEKMDFDLENSAFMKTSLSYTF